MPLLGEELNTAKGTDTSPGRIRLLVTVPAGMAALAKETLPPRARQPGLESLPHSLLSVVEWK